MATEKEEILAEIRRTAEENRGKPLGARSFKKETGIIESRWRGRYWRAWGDAVREAGFAPNIAQVPHGRDALALAITRLAARLGRYPSYADVELEKRRDRPFPRGVPSSDT
jgi:hypothetical protein